MYVQHTVSGRRPTFTYFVDRNEPPTNWKYRRGYSIKNCGAPPYKNQHFPQTMYLFYRLILPHTILGPYPLPFNSYKCFPSYKNCHFPATSIKSSKIPPRTDFNGITLMYSMYQYHLFLQYVTLS